MQWVVYPTEYNMFCMMEGKPLHGCMDWKGATTPTQVLVFDLHNTEEIDPHKPPVGVSTTAAFHSQHHINAYQEAAPATGGASGAGGGTRLVVDTAAYASPTFWTSKYPFGSLEVMRDRDSRNHIAGMATVRRLFIDLPLTTATSTTPAVPSTGAEPVQTNASGDSRSTSMSVTYLDVPVVDEDGNVYTLDFPFINRGDGGPSPSGVDGKPYCVFYAFACNARNSTELAAWATLKVDMCAKAGTPNAKVWYEPQHYPQEPIFVPTPGATGDDDGILLNNVLDGANLTTYLSILDGKTLKELARLDFADKEVLPYMQHAAFFQQ